MFNAKAKTESAMKGWVVMYVRLRNALKEAGRRVIRQLTQLTQYSFIINML